MERFCLSVEDEERSDALLDAIKGKGAFRRFKDKVHAFGIADNWYEFRDDALKRLAVDWCEANGISYRDE